jgi:hypothetical protein
MIVTVYTADGKKSRKPVGYAGGLCNKATEPYERNEISGQVHKTPTAEACAPEPEKVVVDERTQTETC